MTTGRQAVLLVTDDNAVVLGTKGQQTLDRWFVLPEKLSPTTEQRSGMSASRQSPAFKVSECGTWMQIPECLVCKEPLGAPILLRCCKHSFCTSCLLSCEARRCPLCGTDHPPAVVNRSFWDLPQRTPAFTTAAALAELNKAGWKTTEDSAAASGLPSSHGTLLQVSSNVQPSTTPSATSRQRRRVAPFSVPTATGSSALVPIEIPSDEEEQVR